MHTESFLVPVVCILFVALTCGWLFERIKQPPIMGYILAGVILGSLFSSVLPDKRIFEVAGETGLMLMLFFIGSEVDIRKLLGNWKISMVGTLIQILISVGICVLVGLLFDWPLKQSLFFGFMISLSSTAVVLKLLEEFGGQNSVVGKNCLGILLVQDLAIIPMLIVLGLFSGEEIKTSMIARQVLGGIVIIGGGVLLSMKGNFHIPKWLQLHENREFQIFMGLIFCMGAASLTGIFGLSPALGAFIAGMILGGSDHSKELRGYLEPFKILFVAVFFVFIGLIFDISFVADNFGKIISLVFLVLLVNSLLTAAILRFLGVSKITALVTGCLLAQIGEFAFLLSSTALNVKIINNEMYQTSVAVIVFSLVLTPIWFSLARRLMKRTWGESGTMMLKTTDFIQNMK